MKNILIIAMLLMGTMAGNAQTLTVSQKLDMLQTTGQSNEVIATATDMPMLTFLEIDQANQMKRAGISDVLIIYALKKRIKMSSENVVMVRRYMDNGYSDAIIQKAMDELPKWDNEPQKNTPNNRTRKPFVAFGFNGGLGIPLSEFKATDKKTAGYALLGYGAGLHFDVMVTPYIGFGVAGLYTCNRFNNHGKEADYMEQYYAYNFDRIEISSSGTLHFNYNANIIFGLPIAKNDNGTGISILLNAGIGASTMRTPSYTIISDMNYDNTYYYYDMKTVRKSETKTALLVTGGINIRFAPTEHFYISLKGEYYSAEYAEYGYSEVSSLSTYQWSDDYKAQPIYKLINTGLEFGFKF